MLIVGVAIVVACLRPNMSTDVAVWKNTTINRLWPSVNASVSINVSADNPLVFQLEKCYDDVIHWDALLHQWDVQWNVQQLTDALDNEIRAHHNTTHGYANLLSREILTHQHISKVLDNEQRAHKHTKKILNTSIGEHDKTRLLLIQLEKCDDDVIHWNVLLHQWDVQLLADALDNEMRAHEHNKKCLSAIVFCKFLVVEQPCSHFA
jgi:hypothetical protein